MLQIQHQTLFIDKLHSHFEVFFSKKSGATRVMQEFNYEHNFVPNIFHFDDEVIVNKLFFKKN